MALQGFLPKASLKLPPLPLDRPNTRRKPQAHFRAWSAHDSVGSKTEKPPLMSELFFGGVSCDRASCKEEDLRRRSAAQRLLSCVDRRSDAPSSIRDRRSSTPSSASFQTGRSSRSRCCTSGSRKRHRKTIEIAQACEAAATKIQRKWRSVYRARRKALNRVIYAEARRRYQHRKALRVREAWGVSRRFEDACRDVIDAVRACSLVQRCVLTLRAAAQKHAQKCLPDHVLRIVAHARVQTRMQRQLPKLYSTNTMSKRIRHYRMTESQWRLLSLCSDPP